MNAHLPRLEQARQRFAKLVQQHGLSRVDVQVHAKALTPEEAIGTPGRRDFPIQQGRERVIEARVLDGRGHAFTDARGEFEGVLADLLDAPLSDNRQRALFVATLNATLAHLGLVRATVHCKDDDPETCAREIGETLEQAHGAGISVGLIGLNPAIAERLAVVFGPGRVRITDRDPEQVGRKRFGGVEIWDGGARTGELIDEADVVLVTGTTLVNATFDAIWDRLDGTRTPGLVFGVTGAGVCHLLDLPRICPCGRDG